jgi:hypothetical protein
MPIKPKIRDRTGTGLQKSGAQTNDRAAVVQEQSNATAGITLPDWIPSAVKSIAEVFPIGQDIAQRLLTDPRMKKVWPVLLRTTVTSEEIPDQLSGLALALPPRRQVANLRSFERLRTWDISDRHIPLQDQACAAFFAYAALELSRERAIGTRADAIELAAPWLKAAELCRWIKSNDHRSRHATQYLMPSDTNMRTVFVDNSTTPVTFWVGSTPLSTEQGGQGRTLLPRPVVLRFRAWWKSGADQHEYGGPLVSSDACALRCFLT